MEGYLNTPQTAKALKLSKSAVRKHQRAGALPFAEVDGFIIHPQSFVEGLASASNGIPVTREFVLLYKLAWEYYNGITTFSQTITHVNDLRDQEAILTIRETSGLLGYSRRVMSRWRNKGWIRSVRLSPWHFTLRSDIDKLKELIDSFTSYEIANILELPYSTVRHYLKEDKIKTSRTPGDEYRANPNEILELAAHRRAQAAYILPVARAAKILGVPEKTVFHWTTKGLLETVVKDGLRLLLPHEVESLAKAFQTITPGFEWLSTRSQDPRQRQLWTSEKTARHLGVSISWVRKFGKQGLIASYPRTPAGLAYVNRAYSAIYVIGLKAFADSRKVTKAVVEEYNAICRQRQLAA